MSMTVSLQGMITLTDNLTGSVQMQKQLNLPITGTVDVQSNGYMVNTTSSNLPVPVSPATFVYIRNLSTTATVTVTWTPNTAISATVIVLQPGAVANNGSYILFEGTNSSSGITAVSVIASLNLTPIEFLILG